MRNIIMENNENLRGKWLMKQKKIFTIMGSYLWKFCDSWIDLLLWLKIIVSNYVYWTTAEDDDDNQIKKLSVSAGGQLLKQVIFSICKASNKFTKYKRWQPKRSKMMLQ